MWSILKIAGIVALIVLGGVIVYCLTPSEEAKKEEIKLAEKIVDDVAELVVEAAL